MGRIPRVAALLLWGLLQPAGAAGPGDAAPAFRAPALSGGADIALADYRGRVVYLDFWASWCAPCRQSLPWMQGLQAKLGGNGLAVIAVNVDENPADGRRFLAEIPVNFPVAEDAVGSVAALYNVSEMPSSYLIDRKGIVRYVHRGFRRADTDALRERVTALLGEK